ncbi:keratin-associated protein 10-4-like isoform X2 [Halichondria panicea]|uniref:keratin-associated protein 10-4-like isoform X2 n=1 Tax=Halichondria panicea TaxID=6063 RepID=UPI00312BC57E
MTAFVKVALAALLVVHLVSASKNHLHKRARRQGDQRPAYTQQGFCSTGCQNRGYSGCCDITESSCFNTICTCYCDISCHNYGDCCADIDTIGCSITGQGSCPEIPLMNGMITPNSRQVGTIAILSCNDNYSLVPANATVRVCQNDLTWSGPEGACRELCEEISIENGIITYEQDFTTSRKPARTVAVYSCNQGYQLNGLEKRVCQGSSGWSGTISPQCNVFSCMIAFPGTGCAPSIGSPLLGESPNPRCSCHPSCITTNDDCCEDIGCVPPTCQLAGLSQGCCSWVDQNGEEPAGCYVSGRNGNPPCYCDSGCALFNDCCSDVPEPPPTCTPSAAQQSRVRGQSVRTYPFGRAQLARGGRRTQASMEDQAARNMASELMSMSQEQSDKRDRWVAITKELEAIQKKKY